MWLKRVFGIRQDESDIDPDEEPARVAVPAAHLRPAPPRNAPRRQSETVATEDAIEPTLTLAPTKADSAGFDPYNSGTFTKKDNAWEKVVRR